MVRPLNIIQTRTWEGEGTSILRLRFFLGSFGVSCALLVPGTGSGERGCTGVEDDGSVVVIVLSWFVLMSAGHVIDLNND